MFEPLFARLADRYHLVAPDYPGFGHSDWPDPKQFAYTFDHIASVMGPLHRSDRIAAVHAIHAGLWRAVGFRMEWHTKSGCRLLSSRMQRSQRRPWGRTGQTRRAFWATGLLMKKRCANLLSLATTKTRHVGDDPKIELYGPDLWTDEYAFLNAPGQAQIQSDSSTTTAQTSMLTKVAGVATEDAAKAFVIWGSTILLVRIPATRNVPQRT